MDHHMIPIRFRSHCAFSLTSKSCYGPLLALVCGSNLAAWPGSSPGEEVTFEPPVYEIYRTATPIKIDGSLDEPAWFAAPQVGEFHFTWYKEGRKERTVAKLLWDDENLYV